MFGIDERVVLDIRFWAVTKDRKIITEWVNSLETALDWRRNLINGKTIYGKEQA